MKTTKTDEAKSEDDMEEEYRKHVKGVLSFMPRDKKRKEIQYLFRVLRFPPNPSYTIALFAEQKRDAQTRVRRKDNNLFGVFFR